MKTDNIIDQFMEAKSKMGYLERKIQESDSVFNDEKQKKLKIKKQLDEISMEYRSLMDRFVEEERAHKKIKGEKQLWHEQTELLLRNLKEQIVS